MKKITFLFMISLLLLRTANVQAAKTYDYVIQNALVFDGETLSAKKMDVAILGDRIAKTGNLKNAKAKETVEGKGLILAPGFIDTHTHSDFNPLIYPNLPNKVMQGVTTEVVGNCGMSAAPVLGSHKERIAGVWAREGVQVGPQVKWRTFKEYRKILESKGMMTNFVGLVGHGNIRSAVMGFSPRPASQGEIDEMRTMLRDAMRDGAAGISYGLIYLPGIFASEEELVALCQEAGRDGGLCAFHMRNEGSKVVESVEETLRIGEKAQTPIEISHLKAAGKNNWEKIQQVFDIIEKARRKGQKVAVDVYPYTGSYAELGVILPDEIYQREDRMEYFKDLSRREELLAQLRKYYEERNYKWDGVMIAATPHKKYWSYGGKTILQIAKEKEKEPERLLIELLADTHFEVSAFYFSQSEDVITQVLKKEYVSIGSDSVADDSRKPHPRAFGTFARVIERYVRDRREVPLGFMLWKMTGFAAEHFSLKDRGKIKKGYFADLVLFDPEKINERASYEEPKLFPDGFRWVFVNGQAEVKDGNYTGLKSGRFLHRQ